MQLSQWLPALGLCALVVGCGTAQVDGAAGTDSTVRAAQTGGGALIAPTQQSCHYQALPDGVGQNARFTDITPKQALAKDRSGARVCWGGGLREIAQQEDAQGRDCITWLYATVPEKGGLTWPSDATFFMSCGPSGYDRQLLEPFVQATISGKVTGQTRFAGEAIPVIEIDAIYRHSDCLQGETSYPQCVHSYIQPQKKR